MSQKLMHVQHAYHTLIAVWHMLITAAVNKNYFFKYQPFSLLFCNQYLMQQLMDGVRTSNDSDDDDDLQKQRQNHKAHHKHNKINKPNQKNQENKMWMSWKWARMSAMIKTMIRILSWTKVRLVIVLPMKLSSQRTRSTQQFHWSRDIHCVLFSKLLMLPTERTPIKRAFLLSKRLHQ